MKYNLKTKTLKFSSDESALKFHDQLTEIMRFAMSSVGGNEVSEEEALGLTRDFFERYSALSEALSSLRAHFPRGDVR